MADTKWIDLRVILSKTVDNVVVSLKQAREITTNQVYRLIRLDPITCARYFNRKIEVFTKTVLKECKDVIGGMTDYFQVVEFPQRGSPHVHMMAYIDDFEKIFGDKNDPDFVPKV